MRVSRWDMAEALRSFLFPPLCVSCGSVLESTRLTLCSVCRSAVVPVQKDDPLFRAGFGRLCDDGCCSGLATCYRFTQDGPVQALLHALKYEGMTPIGRHLGRELGKRILRTEWWRQAEGIVPVPLHQARLRERGYNQAAIIAGGIAEETGLPLLSRRVRRTRWTASQTTLSSDARRRNVAMAFAVPGRPEVTETGLILVDDVITTGATIRSCAQALQASGTQHIFAASIALAE